MKKIKLAETMVTVIAVINVLCIIAAVIGIIVGMRTGNVAVTIGCGALFIGLNLAS